MDFEISEKTKSATKCEKNFSCLSDETRNCCEVKSSAGYGTLFLKLDHPLKCKYCMPHINSFLCVCPTRSQIYCNYKV